RSSTSKSPPWAPWRVRLAISSVPGYCWTQALTCGDGWARTAWRYTLNRNSVFLRWSLATRSEARSFSKRLLNSYGHPTNVGGSLSTLRILRSSGFGGAIPVVQERFSARALGSPSLSSIPSSRRSFLTTSGWSPLTKACLPRVLACSRQAMPYANTNASSTELHIVSLWIVGDTGASEFSGPRRQTMRGATDLTLPFPQLSRWRDPLRATFPRPRAARPWLGRQKGRRSVERRSKRQRRSCHEEARNESRGYPSHH